jgi:hypothetical protein
MKRPGPNRDTVPVFAEGTEQNYESFSQVDIPREHLQTDVCNLTSRPACLVGR